jgi:hypothetical protein
MAETTKVSTVGATAVFSDGGPRTTIQACDTKRDGDGTVAWILQGDGSGFVELIGAVDRRGWRSCGEVQELGYATGDDLWVKVCRHDKSKYGPVTGAFDPTLEDCRVESV